MSRQRLAGLPKRRTRCRAGLAGLCAVLALACGAPAFELVVTFPGSVDVEVGAPVLYRGIAVGEVVEVTLHQGSPRESARVALRLRIDDRSVVLRDGDSFEVVSGGVLSDARLQITPSEGEAEPLPSGAVVAGVPPAVTRMRESLADALESLSKAAAGMADEVAAELSRSLGGLKFDGPPPSVDDFADPADDLFAAPGEDADALPALPSSPEDPGGVGEGWEDVSPGAPPRP